MERKRFLELLAALPLIGAPLRVIGIAPEPATCKTQSDVEGPFYRSGAPIRPVIETSGSPLRIEGTIFSRDCKTPVADATLDIWHCDNEGNYDMRGFKGRGQVRTDANGHYVFTTIFPPPYGTRPRHIHIKVRAAGREELTTQLYFKGDPNLKNDFARNAEPDRVIALQSQSNLKVGTFDIFL